MIKILNIRFQQFIPLFRTFLNPNTNFPLFSTISDPYYILGVDKKDDFKVIKKQFFKMANQYHPDKNQTAEASQKFLVIKQAFQAIKIERGLMKPVNFVDSTSYQSSRSNANQFNTDEQQFMKNTRDYRVHQQKAQSDEQFHHFNSSFKTIHDINNIKIKVEQGEMKDHSSRLKMQDFKTIIKFLPQSSLSYVIIGAAGIFLIMLLFNTIQQQHEQTIRTDTVVKQSQQSKRRRVSVQSTKQLNQKRQLQSMKQSKQMQSQLRQGEILQGKTSKDLSQLVQKKTDQKSFKTSNQF